MRVSTSTTNIAATRPPQPANGSWTPQDSADLYGVSRWGGGYFAVGDHGRLCVRPRGPEGPSIDIAEIVAGLRERGLWAPVLLRFNDIMDHRMAALRHAFDRAIAEEGYQGHYEAVYPIKVNQQRSVCEQIRDAASRYRFGLEAGSKPELLAVLALTADSPKLPIVCNGFKDEEYIETVVLASRIRDRIYPIVERPSDLDLIIRIARQHNITPRIGVRIKPSAKGMGRWQGSAGEAAKFGLTAAQLVEAVEKLRGADMLSSLQVVHFHIGSQVCDIISFKAAITELAWTYAELRRMGAGITHINVGGGLGIDYDGSRSATDSSVNYDLHEYAADIVYRIKTVCDQAEQPHPNIFSESGRAMVAHGSMLVVEVLASSGLPGPVDAAAVKAQLDAMDDPPRPVVDLLSTYESLKDGRLAELSHDALAARDEAISLFQYGHLSLDMRATAERLFKAIAAGLLARPDAVDEDDILVDDVRPLAGVVRETFFGNFSLFQSMPDAWAIDQLFPVAPLRRLDERPTRRGILADMTCDSDGAITRFPATDGTEADDALLLHDIKEGEPYEVGIFLVGAYQEVLGDLHNLFGDTHAVHIELDDEENSWAIAEVVEGDTVREVLGYLQYDDNELRRAMRKDVERAVRTNRLSVADGAALMRYYENGLAGYTYLE
ncbi:MAG: biosynthetic arginine decarboxylase [Phycisphaeraceae bacterium]|nr:biosynthetic arginine decarboxylase [Phycisphaeraceae bacterium]